MAILIPDSDFAAARAAMDDAIETFAQLSIDYYLALGTMDLNEEGASPVYTHYSIPAIVDYAISDFGKEATDVEAAQDIAGVKLKISLDTLDNLGLVTNNRFIGNMTNDYMVIEGQRFVLDSIAYKGQWKDRPVLVLIYGKKREVAS